MSPSAELPPLPDQTNTIHYQLTHNEVVTGLLKYKASRRRQARWVIPAFLAFGVFLFSKEWYPQYHLLSLVLTFGLLAMAAWKFVRLSVAINRVVARGAHFTAPRTASFDEEGIVSTAPNWRTEFKWPAFKQVTQDAQYFYLHLDNFGTVAILPKRAFSAASLFAFQQYSHCLPPT